MSKSPSALPGPSRAPFASSVYADLARARRGIVDAATATAAEERYALAHVAGLRVAAAVVTARARQTSRRTRRERNVWIRLTNVVPELGEWASYFSAGATKRAVAEARLPGAVTTDEADELLHQVERFLSVVEDLLELGHESRIPGAVEDGDSDGEFARAS